MAEVSLDWRCPYCNNIQSRLLRFRADEQLNDKKLVLRARKAYLTCKYCQKKKRYDTLPEICRLGLSNTQKKITISYKSPKNNI